MSLSGSIALQLQGILQTTRDLGSASVTETLSQRVTITDGATANKSSEVWADTRALTASGTEAIDLSGALTNGIGGSVAFTRIIAMGVVASSSNGSTITLGGAASNAWEVWAGASGDTIKVRPGGALFLTAPDVTGLAVTTSTDQLKVLNNSTAATASYSIFLMGSEA